MPSTAVRSIDYNPETEQLHVTFVTGRRYLYEEVPAYVAEAFRGAFSKGTYFNKYIRDRYEYAELDPDEGE